MKEKRVKNKYGFPFSLRFVVTMSFILTGLLVLTCYAVFSKRIRYNRYIDTLEHDIRMEYLAFADQLSQNHLQISCGQDVRLGLDSMAVRYKGRVMVVDLDYQIICDTNYFNENSYIVHEDIIAVMTGAKREVTKVQGDYFYANYPIVKDGVVQGVMVVQAYLKPMRDVLTGRMVGTTVLSVGLMLICVVGAYFVGIGSARGIKKINEHMEYAKDGNLNEKIPERGFREIRALTSNYNDTIARLMVLDSTRQEFVSNVSHELKTPITSMKVLADSLVQNEEADLAMYKEFMKDIVEEIDRESQIITDLLTLVKMDKKTAEMNVGEVDINNLLEIIIKRVTPIAASRGINISYEKYRDVMAEVDEVKLSLALTNIIENAVKYNIDNGWVKVTLNADHKNFHIKVADSGVGIPEDCKDQVFERFYRVDKARSRDTGGTGLGLAITKNVIMMHRGTIKLYSEYGEGTTFTIKIPIKQDAE